MLQAVQGLDADATAAEAFELLGEAEMKVNCRLPPSTLKRFAVLHSFAAAVCHSIVAPTMCFSNSSVHGEHL